MWAQILNTALGLWLMAAPGIFRYNGVAADNDHIIGPVVASFSIIALSGCTRTVALYNIPLGIWLLLAPWFLGYESEVATFNDMTVGFFVTAFAFFKRKTVQQYNGGWSAIWKPGV
jgi:SPW repeat